MTPQLRRLRKAFAEAFRPSARYVPRTPEEIAAWEAMSPEERERMDALANLKDERRH